MKTLTKHWKRALLALLLLAAAAGPLTGCVVRDDHDHDHHDWHDDHHDPDHP